MPLVLHSVGAPLGEPAAEDFDFLHRALLERNHSLLDGGGSQAFWRPLSHQVYYILLGPLILSHPRVVAAIHLGLLGLASLLLYRTLRPAWPAQAAAAAAVFPLLADSTRTIITWPTHSVDVGPSLFSALALHEASRRRMATSLGALLMALLCKEVSVIIALLLPWVPRAEPVELRARMRWAAAAGAVVAAWGVVYLVVRRNAGLELPHGLEHDPGLLATPLHVRLIWAAWNSLRAVFSLALTPGPWDAAVVTALAVLVALAAVAIGTSSRARARWRLAAPWSLWGMGWALAASATLATIYPLWAPARSLFGSIGLGFALAGALHAAHPVLPAALIAVKLAAFGLAPGPPQEIAALPEERGAFTDFVKVARLQRLMVETRETLRGRYPRLTPRATIGQLNMPRAASYAYGGSKALQVWYRDTTLRWVTFEEFSEHPELPLTTVVQFQSGLPPQVALVETEALRGWRRAYSLMGRGEFPAALEAIDRADTLQTDRGARTFIANLAGMRAICLTTLGQPEAAEREALRGLDLWPENPESKLALAEIWTRRGELSRAEGLLGEVLADQPGHPVARMMLEQVRALRTRPPQP